MVGNVLTITTEIILTIVTFFLSFLISIGLTKWWIKVAKKNRFMGKDMNKYSKKEVAEAGGIAVVSTIVLSLLFYIALKTFILNSNSNLLQISAIIISLLIAAIIGFVDDILGWKKGLKQWQKLLMTLPAAIPLMVINAGHQTINVPFDGVINLGFIYPLILIPIAILGTTNGYNILAGYNGLESGLGIVMFVYLGLFSFLSGQLWLALIALVIVAALLGFLIFNKYPAKVFPGDSLTYSLGVLFGCFVILGSMEKIGIIMFIPFIIEGCLKLRSKLKAENFGIPNKDNSLENPYKKNFSLTHVAMRILRFAKSSHKVYENDVVWLLICLEIIMGLVVYFVYFV